MLSDILSGNLKKSGKAFVPDGTSQLIEAVSQRRSVKKEFLEISQNSQEDTYARVSFLKTRLWHRSFL